MNADLITKNYEIAKERYAALGVDQIGIDKVDNGLCHLWLA